MKDVKCLIALRDGKSFCVLEQIGCRRQQSYIIPMIADEIHNISPEQELRLLYGLEIFGGRYHLAVRRVVKHPLQGAVDRPPSLEEIKDQL